MLLCAFECLLVRIHLSCSCYDVKQFWCWHIPKVLPTILSSQQATVWQHLGVLGIHLYFDGDIVSCTHRYCLTITLCNICVHQLH